MTINEEKTEIKNKINPRNCEAVEGEETGEVLATMTAEVYANTTLEIIDNQVIPGHSHNHTHGHGHGHGHGADNAGGGIVFAD